MEKFFPEHKATKDMKDYTARHQEDDIYVAVKYESTVEGRRAVGRPSTRRLDGVKMGCSARELELTEAKVKWSAVRGNWS